MLTRRLGIVVGVSLAVVAAGLPAWAQSVSPAYYAAQVSGESVAALAGGLVGTLVGGFSGVLIGGAAGFLDLACQQDTGNCVGLRAVDGAFLGAKVGFGLGVGVGALGYYV